MSKKPPQTYEQREAQAIQDLAVSVVADPASSPEDVERAMERLTAPPPTTRDEVDGWGRTTKLVILAMLASPELLAEREDIRANRERITAAIESITAE